MTCKGWFIWIGLLFQALWNSSFCASKLLGFDISCWLYLKLIISTTWIAKRKRGKRGHWETEKNNWDQRGRAGQSECEMGNMLQNYLQRKQLSVLDCVLKQHVYILGKPKYTTVVFGNVFGHTCTFVRWFLPSRLHNYQRQMLYPSRCSADRPFLGDDSETVQLLPLLLTFCQRRRR